MKLRPLLPTLKEKKRYLVFEIISKNKIANVEAVSNAIMQKSFQFLGELGVSKAGIQVLEDQFNAEKQKGIIRISRKHVDEMRAVLALINKIGNEEAIMKSVGVSGIMKKARGFI